MWRLAVVTRQRGGAVTAVFSSVPSQIETDAVIRDAVDAAGVLLRRQLERCKTQQPLTMYRAVFSWWKTSYINGVMHAPIDSRKQYQ